MKPLARHEPTPDQLTLIRDNDPGNVLIRGAAGSGKTTTALMRLELVTRYWLNRRLTEGSSEPVRVMALAFNRTLVGYMRELAEQQMPSGRLVKFEVETVAAFNKRVAGYRGAVWDTAARADTIWSLGRSLGYSRQFLVDEVDYVVGRFPPDRLTDYLDTKTPRLGRGRTPVVTVEDRNRIYSEVILPLEHFKEENTLVDWNDLAILAAATEPAPDTRLDIVVVDEAQDFSVNQMRSVVTHLAPTHSLTAVTDTAQRIYPRYLYFPEAGLAPFARIYTLPRNFRNTPVIAALAAGIVQGLTLDDDATVPSAISASWRGATGDARQPALLSGLYSAQLDWVIRELGNVDLQSETAAIMTIRGHGFWAFTRSRLMRAGLSFIELQQKKEWPEEPANLALSTLHSAKGLEFDHVYILGLNDELTEHDDGEDDATLDRWRRLLGMAVGRARKSVALGYKPGDPSRLIDYIDRSLVAEIDVT